MKKNNVIVLNNIESDLNILNKNIESLSLGFNKNRELETNSSFTKKFRRLTDGVVSNQIENESNFNMMKDTFNSLKDQFQTLCTKIENYKSANSSLDDFDIAHYELSLNMIKAMN